MQRGRGRRSTECSSCCHVARPVGISSVVPLDGLGISRVPKYCVMLLHVCPVCTYKRLCVIQCVPGILSGPRDVICSSPCVALVFRWRCFGCMKSEEVEPPALGSEDGQGGKVHYGMDAWNRLKTGYWWPAIGDPICYSWMRVY